MTRFLVYATVAACLLGGAAIAARQQTPIFRAAGDAVRVFVTVTDRDGRMVTTLTRDDFQLRDEGKPQPITLFDNSPQPIRLIVMLDVSGSMEGNLPLLRAATAQLLTRLGPEDEVRLGTFGDRVTLGPEFTRDRNAVLRMLPTSIAFDALTPLWRAIDESIEAFAEDDGDERRVILVLSDGKDSGPINFGEPTYSQGEVIDRARLEDVMVYGVGMRSRSRPRPPGLVVPGSMQAALMADLPDPGLAMVAEQTGGGYIELRPTEDLGEAFARVADELHAQYLLGFEPPKRDGKVHKVDVRVAQKGMKVRARKSYVAPRS